MPRYANVRTGELRNLLLRMGFVETACVETVSNDHWRCRHPGLRLRTMVSFGSDEIDATFMGRIITGPLKMTVAEFRAAMHGDLPERFINPALWPS